MLDINFIKENLELCKTAAINKNRTVDWERLVTLDETRRKLTKSVDDLRAQRNEISKKPIEIARVEGKQIKESLKGLEEELKKVEEELQVVLFTDRSQCSG